eukprot:354616-Chlamydomonas_euryale.AAC.3
MPAWQERPVWREKRACPAVLCHLELLVPPAHVADALPANLECWFAFGCHANVHGHGRAASTLEMPARPFTFSWIC